MRYVYDKADRLIFVQDGNLKGQGRWRFTIPDALGRTVLSGLCSEPLPVDRSAVEAEFTGSGSYKGYAVKVGGTVRALSGSRLLTVNYYDNYDFLGKNGFPAYAYDSSMESSGYGTKSDARGMLTGSVTGLAGDGAGQLYSVVYYDRRSRPVQRQSSNSLGGKETEYTAYNFTGQPTRLRHVHTAQGKAARTEVRTYSYDHAGRLLTVKHKLDALGEVTLVNNVYDDLGRLQSKSLHGSAVNKQTYTYNIRGWLTGVSGSKFTQNLYYNTGNGVVKYNGSISSMTWKAGNESTVRGYKFTYDGLDRLLNAIYGETAGISTNANRFSENVTNYDKNGNIKGLQRYGQTGASAYGLIDNLTFTLNGNRLNRVDDAVTASTYGGGFEFKDGVKQANEYAYDANGNLTKDLNKGITGISYNCLNLPNAVTFSDGSTITYTYGADGTKLRTVHKIGSATTTTDYCGNVIYENGVQKLLLTEEGYVTLSDSKYHYYLKDHQGNNRVVINQSGTVEETNHYYPFGGVFASAGSIQPYKYNGKEFDNKKGLNWYDYGARHYDTALGRFTTNDRFAEKYYSMSPYQYGANSPVVNIDVNGDSITVLNYGYIRKQYMAILIQNDAGEWQYFSVNGDNVYVSGEFSGGRKFNDIAVGEFDSPQEFLNSPYNSYGASDDMSINTYGFSEGYMIPTSKEQDDIIRDTFISISKNESYDFLGNNCSTVVQKSLEAAGIITFTQKSTRHRIPSSHYLGESSFIATISTSRPVIPSVSFRAIIKNNPQGKMIYR